MFQLFPSIQKFIQDRAAQYVQCLRTFSFSSFAFDFIYKRSNFFRGLLRDAFHLILRSPISNGRCRVYRCYCCCCLPEFSCFNLQVNMCRAHFKWLRLTKPRTRSHRIDTKCTRPSIPLRRVCELCTDVWLGFLVWRERDSFFPHAVF